MYDHLKQMVKDDPEGAVELTAELLEFVRLPERAAKIGRLLDDLSEQGFVSRASKVSGASDAVCAESAMLLSQVLSLAVLADLLPEAIRGADELDAETAETMQTIIPYADSLPGLISHYDGLGPRNIHDYLILQCLKLGFLQVTPTPTSKV
jgi:hypothetical protein